MKHWQLLLLTISADAYPQLKRASFPGIATFNDYAAQGTTVCGRVSGQAGTYAAAASDLSGNISGGKCEGTIDPSQCDGQKPVAGYQPPSCPKTNCGTCYSVTNAGKTITVQIVDSCPSTNAANFCKTNVPANHRCSAPGVNQLDIDQSAYQALTGKPFGSGGDLQIQIAEASCSGGGTDTAESGTATAGSGTTPDGASGLEPAAQFPKPLPQTSANTQSQPKLAAQKLGAQTKNMQVVQSSNLSPLPLSNSSVPTGSQGSSNPAGAGGSSNPAGPGGSSNPAGPGGSSDPAGSGGSSNPAGPGGSSDPAGPGGSSDPAGPGGSSDPATVNKSKVECTTKKSKNKKKRSLRAKTARTARG